MTELTKLLILTTTSATRATRVCLQLNPFIRNRIKPAALHFVWVTTAEERVDRIKTAALTTEAGA